MYFGGFIGPTLAGFLVEAYGFPWTTVLFFWLLCLSTIVDIVELTCIVWQLKITNVSKNNEVLPLLKNNS